MGDNLDFASGRSRSPGRRLGLVAAASEVACGIRADGSLWCWSRNLAGRLGQGDNLDHPEPVRVAPGSTWVSVTLTLTYHNVCGVRTDGTLWCWGDNSYHQLADGTTTTRYAPVQVGAATTWTSAAVGPEHVHGSWTDGTRVLRCLASSSDAALIGRPALHGLAVDGAQEVRHVLRILTEELAVDMAIAGVGSVANAGPDLVGGEHVSLALQPSVRR